MEKQHESEQLEFIYPVPFEDFVGFRNRQRQAIMSNFDVKQLSKIRKMKKMLEETQEKIRNRIKLFKKVSLDIRKKKEKEKQNFQDRATKNSLNNEEKTHDRGLGYMRSTKSSMGLIRIRKHSEEDRAENSMLKMKRVLEEKLDHAKQIKIQKQRNKAIMEQRRQKQMRQKLQSAKVIRSNRFRAKEIKHMCEQERLDEARKMKEQKWKEEVEKYDQLQENLTKLQREERDALILWKQALEEDLD